MTPLRISGFTFRNALIYGGCVVLALLFFAYITFQSRFLLLGPQLALSSEPSVVQTERRVLIEGNAQNITKITLNGRAIHTTADGNFSEFVTLENGYTMISIQAEDRYGRQTALHRPFVYSKNNMTLLSK